MDHVSTLSVFETVNWRIRHNEELKSLFQKPCIIAEITRKKIMWAGYVRRKEGSFIKAVIKDDSTGKRPLGKPHLRWDDCIKKYIKAVEPKIRRREVSKVREK